MGEADGIGRLISVFNNRFCILPVSSSSQAAAVLTPTTATYRKALHRVSVMAKPNDPMWSSL